MPQIDLFASRLNNQIDRYMAWKPDPGAEAIDAFTIQWNFDLFYAFPPFNTIGRVLKKIVQDEATGLLVVPYWPTQYWFSMFTNLLTEPPYLLFSRGEPTLLHPWRPEDQLPRTRWLVGHLSAQHSVTGTSTRTQKTSFWPLGGPKPRRPIGLTLNSSAYIVRNGERIQIHRI